MENSLAQQISWRNIYIYIYIYMYGTIMYILYNMVFLGKVSIFIWIWRHFTILGFKVLLFWPTLSPMLLLAISQNLCPRSKQISLPWYPSGICFLVDPQKYHIIVLSTKIRTVDWVWYWYEFPQCFEERKKLKTERGIGPPIYIHRKNQRLV